MFCCLDMRKYQLLFWKRQNQRRLHPDQTFVTVPKTDKLLIPFMTEPKL